MTDEEKIQNLVEAPLEIPLNPFQRFMARFEPYWPMVQKICSVVAVLAMITATTTVVLVFQLAVCTNTNLGTRQGPANLDTQAHIDYASAQKTYEKAESTAQSAADKTAGDLFALVHAPKAKQAGLYVTFLTDFGTSRNASTALTAAQKMKDRATDTYVRQLKTDKAARAKHPLGKC